MGGQGEGRVVVWLLDPGDRPHYQAQWLEPGTTRRRTRSLRTADPDEAERRRADLEYELTNGLHAEPVRLSWEAFLDRYGREKLAARKTGPKIRQYLERFGREARPAGLAAVSAALLSRHAARLREAGLKAVTVRTHLAHLRSALRWAERQRLIPRAPAVEAPPVPRVRRVRTTDGAGYRRLLAAMPTPGWRLFLATAWHTGLRRGELFELAWEEGPAEAPCPWLDLPRSRVWLPAEGANKAAADSWLPLHPELAAELAAWPGPRRGRVFALSGSPREVSRTFCRLARAAGVAITLHDVRRSFGSRYARVVPAQVLRRIMRHSDIKTTLEYYTDLDDGLDEAIRRL